MTRSTFVFKPSDYAKLGKALGVKGKARGNNVRFEVENSAAKRKLAVEVYSNILIGKQRGNLVTVYTPHAHLQLHFCSGYVVSEMLGEVTFIGLHDGKVSGIIVEKEGGCSLYANVDRALLSGDFTQLGPEVMLSGVALSLTETGPSRAGEEISKEKKAVMVEVAVWHRCPARRFTKKTLRQIAVVVFRKEKIGGGKLSFVFVDDKAIKKINTRYLGHRSSTDVITFLIEAQPSLEAEIYINVQQARRQARQYRVTIANEVTRLVVHGILHALGYDDKRTNQRKKMFTLQEE